MEKQSNTMSREGKTVFHWICQNFSLLAVVYNNRKKVYLRRNGSEKAYDR